MQQDGFCRSCSKGLPRGEIGIRTPNHGAGSSNLYFCTSCARKIAKIVLADEDLNEFGQELVMDKLVK